jgi:hypothetical protein
VMNFDEDQPYFLLLSILIVSNTTYMFRVLHLFTVRKWNICINWYITPWISSPITSQSLLVRLQPMQWQKTKLLSMKLPPTSFFLTIISRR